MNVFFEVEDWRVAKLIAKKYGFTSFHGPGTKWVIINQKDEVYLDLTDIISRGAILGYARCHGTKEVSERSLLEGTK